MPVVGKRYRRKGYVLDDDAYEIEVIALYRPSTRWKRIVIDNPNFAEPINVTFENFWDMFEELPDSNLQKPEEVQVNQTPNPVDFEKKEVNEVERALDELKKSINLPLNLFLF